MNNSFCSLHSLVASTIANIKIYLFVASIICFLFSFFVYMLQMRWMCDVWIFFDRSDSLQAICVWHCAAVLNGFFQMESKFYLLKKSNLSLSFESMWILFGKISMIIDLGRICEHFTSRSAFSVHLWIFSTFQCVFLISLPILIIISVYQIFHSHRS